LFVRVRGDQAGIHINHHPALLHRRAGVVPDPLPGRRPRRVDRRQNRVGVRGQGRDQPRHRRVRGDPAEHTRLGAQHRDIGCSVPAQRDRDRQIGHDLPRVMDRERLTPPPNSRDSCPARPLRRAVSTSNTPPACDTSDSPPMITDNQGRKSLCFTRGVPLSSIGLGLDNHNQTALSRHFRVSGLRVSPTRSTSVKARG
jgi:hypothetical protein